MAEHLLTSITTIILAIVGIAFVAVLVSKNAGTARVLGVGAQSFSAALGTAFAPITGFTGIPPITITGG